MSNEIFLAYKSLKQGNEKEITLNYLRNVGDYLLKLCKEIAPRGLKKVYIHQWIFKTNFHDKDVDNYLKANIYSACISFKRLLDKIWNDEISDVNRRIFIDFLCDLKPFIVRYDNEQEYSWLLGNTNSHITNFYFDLAQNTFWRGNSGDHPEEKHVLSSITPFIIRQCIEYRVKGILNINRLQIDGKDDIRIMNKCFQVLESNKYFYALRDFDFKIVEKIYSWSSIYIHGGYRPEPWRTESALDYLKSLFYSGPLSKPNSFSIHASVEVHKSKLMELQNNTERAFKNLSKEDCDISWSHGPEVGLI